MYALCQYLDARASKELITLGWSDPETWVAGYYSQGEFYMNCLGGI